MKRIVMLALLAVTFLAANPVRKTQNPAPTCDPCPWVR
jgi:hypothetical protein